MIAPANKPKNNPPSPCCKGYKKLGYCPYIAGMSRRTGKPLNR